jgi:hypothetical protein
MVYSTAAGAKVAVGYPFSDYGIVYTNSIEFVWKDGPVGDPNKSLE